MHPAFSFPRDSMGAECPTVESIRAPACRRAPSAFVGAGTAILEQGEVQQHIDDLTHLWMAAYARYEAHRLPADREEALVWLHLRDQASLERDRVARERRAAFGAAAGASEGCAGFFASDAALTIGGAA